MTKDIAQTQDEKTVYEFYDLWRNSDVEVLLPYFTDDAVYVDMPLPPRRGLQEIRAYIEGVFGAFTVVIETTAIASRGDFVFTERIDHLRLHETGASVPLPIAGVVEMRDGKIARWRDYLDILTAEEGLGIPLRPAAS